MLNLLLTRRFNIIYNINVINFILTLFLIFLKMTEINQSTTETKRDEESIQVKSMILSPEEKSRMKLHGLMGLLPGQKVDGHNT